MICSYASHIIDLTIDPKKKAFSMIKNSVCVVRTASLPLPRLDATSRLISEILDMSQQLSTVKLPTHLLVTDTGATRECYDTFSQVAKPHDHYYTLRAGLGGEKKTNGWSERTRVGRCVPHWEYDLRVDNCHFVVIILLRSGGSAGAKPQSFAATIVPLSG